MTILKELSIGDTFEYRRQTYRIDSSTTKLDWDYKKNWYMDVDSYECSQLIGKNLWSEGGSIYPLTTRIS